VKGAVGQVPVIANTGVTAGNVEEQLAVADGAIIGTAFKGDADIWNPVEVDRVSAVMEVVKSLRHEERQ
jgi:predicted TIM-barrel enzyme